MRSRSLCHSCSSASIVFTLLSSEHSMRLLAHSTRSTTPPRESDSARRAAESSFCAPVMAAHVVCSALTVSCTPEWRKCRRNLSPSNLATDFGSRPASISPGRSAIHKWEDQTEAMTGTWQEKPARISGQARVGHGHPRDQNGRAMVPGGFGVVESRRNAGEERSAIIST